MQNSKQSQNNCQHSSTSQNKVKENKQQNNIKIEENFSPIYSNFLSKLQIQNVVSTVNLNTQLNLKQIALQARNAEYNPRRFASVIMRLKDPKSTALIFSSGKMVCTGSKDEIISKTAMRKFARILQKLGYPVQFGKFEVQNIVASCDTGMTLDLDQIVNKHSTYTNYEPEIFPGLVYRMLDPKIVLLIFVSGKIVLTGAKRKQDIESAFKKIIPVLIEVQKKPLKI